MSLTARFHCPLCPFFGADRFDSVLRHIGITHSFDSGFSITCGIDGCQSTYRNLKSYRRHISRKHKTFSENASCCEENTPTPDCAMEFEHEEAEQCSKDLLRDAGAKFLLRMKDGLSLSQHASDEMVSGITELFGGVASHLHQSIRKVIGVVGDSDDYLDCIDGIFQDESNINPFLDLSSQHRQRKYFKEHFGLLEPTERKLGHSLVRKYHGGSSKFMSQGHFCYEVDLLKSIESLLQIDSVLEQIENPHHCVSDLMNDMCDGEAFKGHPLYSVEPQALQIMLYYDELEICNPLGASVKKHKLGAFYFTLGNLLPRNRSLLHSIQLVALVKSSIIQLYGIDVILEPFMESIRKLEEGHDFLVRGNLRNMKGTLLLVSADNLASHYVGGYKSLHSALRKCRYCLATEADMRTKFTAESFTSRTRDAHKRYIEALSRPNPDHISTTYGVARDSILNQSAFFHVVDGLPPDVLHDILEGLLQYEVKLLLGHLINEEHLFTLKQLNQQLESFDYGYHMSKDKPSPISDARLHSQGSNLLGQSATKMWCLGRILPLLVGHWVPEDHTQYLTFLLLRNILDITMAPVTSVEKVMYLRELIDDHHQCFRECYPAASITPKMHYIIHLPQWMMRFGPLVRFWTMRFEGRHKLFKKLSSVMGNFINIPKSLAQRYQEYQCYHLLNKDNYFRQEAVFGKITRRHVRELEYKETLRARLRMLTEDDAIETTAMAEVMGTSYRPKCCVLIGHHQLMPQFGQILDIVVDSSHIQVYLVVEILTTTCFYSHYFSYEVVATPNSHQAVFLPSELKDFQVLHLRQVTTERGTVKLITPKYNIDP